MNASAAHSSPEVCRRRATLNAHRAFAGSALICLLAFGWMVTFGSFRFVADDSFGSFYDHQAAAWLHGRWDVPEPSLSSEAFEVDGKVYGYFGPTPSLLRLPLVLLGIGFGSVTRILMLLDYAACVAAAYALLWSAHRWRDPAAIPHPLAVGLSTLTAGLGSMLFFLGSRAYVYHEAILCGAAFGLWSVVFSLRYLQAPEKRSWIGALVCGVLAVHARAPIGLFVLAMLGCAGLAGILRNYRGGSVLGRRRHALAVASSLLGIASFNGVSYLKFGTFEGCPLRFNVQYTPEDLARVQYRNFHLANLRFNSDAYLFRPTFALNGNFPYLYREFSDRKAYPESKLVYRDPTLGIPWAMPGLFAQAIGGTVLAVLAVPALRLPLAVIWAAALPAMIAMLTAISVTQRYTADFCPFLIAASAFGFAAVAALTPGLRRLVSCTATSLGVLGVVVTVLLTLHHQRETVWGVPEEARQSYQRFRADVDAFFGRSKVVDYPQNDRGS